MKKRDKFDVVKAVKANARERIGSPKPQETIVSKRDKLKRKRNKKVDDFVGGTISLYFY